MSYCQRQRDAVLKICVNCRRAVYMTVPSYEVCMHCRAGLPALGPIIPRLGMVCDISGVPMESGD